MIHIPHNKITVEHENRIKSSDVLHENCSSQSSFTVQVWDLEWWNTRGKNGRKGIDDEGIFDPNSEGKSDMTVAQEVE